jgi:diacylglycerol kinase family enzyme
VQATLVHNPTAGTRQPSAKKLIGALTDAGFSPLYCKAKDDSLCDVLKDASGIVVAAGGDGTVTRVATQIPDRDIPIAIIPLGTANNIARSFGITGTFEEIVAGLR